MYLSHFFEKFIRSQSSNEIYRHIVDGFRHFFYNEADESHGLTLLGIVLTD